MNTSNDLKPEAKQLLAAWCFVKTLQNETALMEDIFQFIVEFYTTENIKPLRAAEDFLGTIVADADGFRSFPYPVMKIDTNHHVSNADLKFWHEFLYFAARDYLEEKTEPLALITRMLHRIRLYQSFCRYQATGVRDEHRKLLAHMTFENDFSRSDWRSIYVDGKRPFGDSAKEESMLNILGWDAPDEDEKIPQATTNKLWDIFDELPFALRDILRNMLPQPTNAIAPVAPECSTP